MPLPVLAASAIGLDALRVNPLRTILSTLGVIIGVAALVSVLSVGDGMERAMRSQIAETTDLQAISVSARTYEESDGQIFPRRDTVVFSPADARELSAITGVDAVVLQVQGFVEVRATDRETRRMAMLLAEVTFGDTTVTPALEAGRRLTENERAGDSGRILVSHDLARALSPDSNARSLTGHIVLIGGDTAVIVGILTPPAIPSTVMSVGRGRRNSDYRVLAPFQFARHTLPAARRGPASMVVVSDAVEQTAAVKQRVEAWFAQRDSGWARRVSVTTSERRLEQISQGILMFKLFMGAITGISLLVGGIGIMNVLLSSVTERTREIGIRKAAGARGKDIRMQFLAESIAISGAGSAIGLVLGVTGAFGITALIRHFSRAQFLHAAMSWSTLLVAAAAAIVVGLTFGTYPARRAARLSPIDAIRHE